MSKKTTAFYRGNTAVSVDFSAEGISSDGAVLLLETLERKHKVISRFSRHIPDKREASKVDHSIEKLLKQRVFTLMQGYEDCNDVGYLKTDPLFADVLESDMASQPTLPRFENSVDKHALFDLCGSWVDRYVDSLEGRSEIIIDIDATDDPTHGHQQLSMFHGYYGHFMYNELFFHGRANRPDYCPGPATGQQPFQSVVCSYTKTGRPKNTPALPRNEDYDPRG